MKKLLATTAVVLLSALAVYAADQAKDYVIMKVGGDEVKRSEIDSIWKSLFSGSTPPDFDTFNAGVRDNVLRGVASEHLLYQEAEKAGVENSDEVKQRLEEAKRQLIIQEFLKEKAESSVTDAQVKAAYDTQVKALGNDQEELHLRHILLKNEADAKAIEKKLKKGSDFAKVGAEIAQDKEKGASWGDLGWQTSDRMTPELSKAAFALKKGGISAPVKTDFGWQIIQVEDRRKVTPPSYEEVKDRLRRSLEMQAMRGYVDSLLAGNKITVLDAEGHEHELAAKPEAMPAASPSAGGSKQ